MRRSHFSIWRKILVEFIRWATKELALDRTPLAFSGCLVRPKFLDRFHVAVLTGEPKSTQKISGTLVVAVSDLLFDERRACSEGAVPTEARSQWKGKPLEGDREVSVTL